MNNDSKHYDIAILGGGHAGSEAAFCASQFQDLKIALISMPGVGLASAPCNPAVGGVGKGQVVREIDALGGLMGMAADHAGIHYKLLNESKGPAVQSTRIQIDKSEYSRYVTEKLSNINNLNIILQKISSVDECDYGYVCQTESGDQIFSKKVIITTGTFLGGKLHEGKKIENGGRVGVAAASGISELFSKVQKLTKRFKTGTPPRLRRDSIDFSKTQIQPSENDCRNFHYLHNATGRFMDQVDCYLTYTNEKTTSLISDSKDLSPIFNGQITGIGPRYCPSIEDKVFRYPDKSIHHVFLEPEELHGNSIYPNGISTCLPENLQLEFVRTIDGLENAEILVPGYAVEYDVVNTVMLSSCLEHKELSGCYFAGQVNGTSGYEEAAGQGLVAGYNAALSLLGKNPLILNRYDSYLGVMIEDLVTNLRDEPYRLFTARSENRLFLREDNSLSRMKSYRTSLGLSGEIDELHRDHESDIKVLRGTIDKILFHQDSWVESLGVVVPHNGLTLTELMRTPGVEVTSALKKSINNLGVDVPHDVAHTVAIELKYEGYITKNNKQYERQKKLGSKQINWQLLVDSKNISFECKQRIKTTMPETFSQLKNIEGIRPATLAYVSGTLS